MPRSISRRDFLNGTALAIGAGLTPLDQAMAQGARGGAYPPALLGMRGSTDAAFRAIHALALEGRRFDLTPVPVAETYDLVVVGAGLAGLTAAWAFRERRPQARILILDNNDDFGGHARRTEHTIGGRTLVSYGGSESLVAPSVKFKGELARILQALRIEPAQFEQESVFHRMLYPGLGMSRGVFFDSESFGQDRLVTGDPLLLGYDEFAPGNPNARPIAAFLADCPLSGAARDGLLELFEGRRDYLADLTTEAKLALLDKTSYRQLLTDICKLPADAANFFQGRPTDNWGLGIDCVSALQLMGDGYPGAKALGIEAQTTGDAAERAAYIHHFPDGNATLARALVLAMIPGVVPGHKPAGVESLVTAKLDYARLDRPTQGVRLRLEATVVRVENTASGVDVGYVKAGEIRRIRARQAIVATYASAMPHICPEIDAGQAQLMRANVRSPLVYTKVAVRSWESFVRLGVHRIAAPMGFHSVVKLDYPVSFGRYRFQRDPKGPAVLHLVHVPLEPGKGLDARQQSRAGRARLLGMPFARFETAVRSDLARMLGSGGFDAERDITGITVGRWSHGYSYAPSSLYDDVEAMADKEAMMKARLGNIAFASSDTGWDAYAHTAMAEAVRAVAELTGAG